MPSTHRPRAARGDSTCPSGLWKGITGHRPPGDQEQCTGLGCEATEAGAGRSNAGGLFYHSNISSPLICTWCSPGKPLIP